MLPLEKFVIAFMDTRVRRNTGAITFKFYASKAFNAWPTDGAAMMVMAIKMTMMAMMLPKTTLWHNKNVTIKLYCPGQASLPFDSGQPAI